MRHKHLEEKLEKLIEKYSTTGQDISSYLEGLLYSDYLSYWDYINLDTLLTLQSPKTDFPDENIFIIYHQITELYFKLINSHYETLKEMPLATIEEITDKMQSTNLIEKEKAVLKQEAEKEKNNPEEEND